MPSARERSNQFDVIVLGAGAAGLFCSSLAGSRKRRVLLIDHAEKAGKKILISGGGRCNFTNLHTRPENFLSQNPHFAKSALSRYTPADFVALVEQHRIPYHEKTLGQLFCDRHAHEIVAMLERECAEAGVRLLLGTRVAGVTQMPEGFRIETSAGSFISNVVVVATGGLSIPKMGASGLGYQIAESFGLKIVPTRPALVPLVFSSQDQAAWRNLGGLSAEVIASMELQSTRTTTNRESEQSFREKLLITHRGLSGPAILQISSYWQPGQPIYLDLAPGQDLMQPIVAPNIPVPSTPHSYSPKSRSARRDLDSIYGLLRNTLPARMAERWLALYPPASWTNASLTAFEQQLHRWKVVPAGTEGYEKAEVTAGGVDTAELDARTMQSKKVPGLYFIGEVVDVTGWLGGYNFQWAWASAHAAATSL